MPVASAYRGAVGLRRAGAAPRRRSRSALQRDPQQEQVEDGEEAELQRDGDGLERHRAYSSSNVIVDGPELDLVPRLEHLGAVDAAAVDRDAVGRAEVA